VDQPQQEMFGADESWLSILASSCARTTTLRARSVNLSNILRWPFWQILVASTQTGQARVTAPLLTPSMVQRSTAVGVCSRT
jgi:hypothetical protein